MKIAIMLEEGNFRRYAAAEKLPADYELCFYGNGTPDEDAIAASGAEMLVADPMTPVSGALLRRMPRLKLLQSQGVGVHLFDLETAGELGIAVANYASLLDPEAVIFTGGIANAGHWLFDQARKVFEENVFHNTKGNVKFVLSEFNDMEHDVIGAGELAWQVKEYSLFK